MAVPRGQGLWLAEQIALSEVTALFGHGAVLFHGLDALSRYADSQLAEFFHGCPEVYCFESSHGGIA